MDFLRLIGAALFVFAGICAFVALLPWLGEHLPGPLVGLVMAAIAAVLVVAALYLFNGGRLPKGKPWDEAVREYEALGLLRHETFSAKRWFEVEEFEDEGRHLYIEVDNGSVLYLDGQYLYDYDCDSPEPGRAFPCTQFTIRRHRHSGYACDIVCEGPPLKQDALAPPFTEQDVDNDRIPEDGQVMTGISYDALKAARRARTG